MTQRIGLISDTHGLVRVEALAALAGADRILHAGDVGRPEVLEALGRIAPVAAVRGNVDRDPWAEALPMQRHVEIAGHSILLVHEDADDARSADDRRDTVRVSGHSHRPGIEVRDGCLCINPGSAGPRRFRLPVTVGWLELRAGEPPAARIVELDVPPPRPRRSRR